MNKLNKLLGLLVLLPLLASGADQEDSDQDIPPPRLPLPHNASAPASWTITAKVNPGLPELKFRYLAQQTLAKGSKILGIVNHWSDGTSTECWVADGLNLSGKSGSSNIMVYTLRVRWLAKPYVDYSNSDFPELSWISLDNYAGIRPYHGRKCYAFEMSRALAAGKNSAAKKKDSPATPAPTPQPQTDGAPVIKDTTTAYVDVATHLPVAVNDGVFTREYVFAPSASEPIMPDNFAAQLKSTLEAIANPYHH